MLGSQALKNSFSTFSHHFQKNSFGILPIVWDAKKQKFMVQDFFGIWSFNFAILVFIKVTFLIVLLIALFSNPNPTHDKLNLFVVIDGKILMRMGVFGVFLTIAIAGSIIIRTWKENIADGFNALIQLEEVLWENDGSGFDGKLQIMSLQETQT